VTLRERSWLRTARRKHRGDCCPPHLPPPLPLPSSAVSISTGRDPSRAQVLHRPPVSAIYFENRAHNMVASAHIWTKSQFAAPQTVKSILDGACMLTLTNLGEEYW
jgi:hypothetical protein